MKSKFVSNAYCLGRLVKIKHTSGKKYHTIAAATWIWPRGYETFFMLNLVEHEILNAHKDKTIKKFGVF